jgi:hypothetical protein
MKTYKKEWESLGLLSSTPEDRKDKVVNAINIAIDAMIEDATYIGDIQFETIPVPVIIKIVNTVDVPDEEIPRICHEVCKAFKEFDINKEKINNNGIDMDYEAKFLCDFADLKIDQIKKQTITIKK